MGSALSQVRVRILGLAGVCLLTALALAYRFYTVQIIRHDELLEKAERWYTTSTEKMNQRGRIYDADGYLLVGNMPKIHVSCSPYSIVYEPFVHLEKSLKPGVRESIPRRREERRRKVAHLLSVYFGKSSEEYYALLEPYVPRKDASGNPRLDKNGEPILRRNQHLVLDKAADPEVVDGFKSSMKAADLHLGGFVFDNIFVRHYPKGRMLSNVVGFAATGKNINTAHGGLEITLSKTLTPENFKQTFQKDGSGRALAYGDRQVNAEGHDGDDVFLTIKEPVQAILEEELDRAVQEHDADAVYAIIVDPRTGNIIAMSQRPNFNPDDPKTLTNENLSNRIAVNAYEPGSVMKPFTIAKALDFGVITPETIIDCGSSRDWYYAGRRLSDFRGYGEMTPGGVLKKSSNIGTAKIALMMGDEKVYRMLKDFRFGTRTGLPFASESRGRLPGFPFPDKLTVTRAPIGYAVQVSALQLARGYCALANNGNMPALRLLDRRRDAESGEFVEYPYEEPVKVIHRPETIPALTEMLISVTAKDGTGRRAAIPGYEVAGKTGTSQKLEWDPVARKMIYGQSFRATFCGFVPARRPELVMVVTFDGVRGKNHGGGNVAAPVFQRTMSRVLQLLNVQPDFPDKLEK